MVTRKNEIKVRLDDREFSRLNNDVKKAGVSREAYIRSLIRNVPLKEQPPREYHEVLKELRLIGMDMSQVAVRASSEGVIDAERYWDSTKKLQACMSKLIKEAY